VRRLVELWQEATGGRQVYLADILASGPTAADELRRLVSRLDQEQASELGARLEHFVAENEQIVGPAGDALASADLAAFGNLVDRSQELSGSLLGNQVPQTVALAALARQEGASAASAFGAGFGGSVWALVARAEAPVFARRWQRAYGQAFPSQANRAAFVLTEAGPAAFEVTAD
jgi:galactokinase